MPTIKGTKLKAEARRLYFAHMSKISNMKLLPMKTVRKLEAERNE